MPKKVEIVRSSHPENFIELFNKWNVEAIKKGYEDIETDFTFQVDRGGTNHVCYITYRETK